MATLVAINAIVVSDPNAQFEHSGVYDKNGNAILHKSSITIQPGQLFEYEDGAELDRLIDNESARYPTDAEITLYRNHSKEA